MRLTLPAAVVAALTLCSVPATASASTTIERTGSTLFVGSVTPGEASDLELDASTPGTLSAYDNALPLDPGAGCADDGSGGVTCDLTGVTKIKVSVGPGDDVVSVWGTVPTEIDGVDGDDTLFGGDGADVLTGGAGQDTLGGYGGNDKLLAADGEEDAALDCGDGDDDLDDDARDPGMLHCEVVAPELASTPALTASAWQAGGTAGVTNLQFTAIPAMTTTVKWERCSTAGHSCMPVQTTTGASTAYAIQPADAGGALRATVEASNRAGKGTYTSALSPVIAAAAKSPVTVTPTPRTTPIGGLPGGLTPNDLAGMAKRFDLDRIGTELGANLGAATKQLTKLRLRKLAAQKTTAVEVGLPAAGTLKLTWTVTPAVARKLGLKAKGKAPVVLASGTARGAANKAVSVKVTPTAAGRRALRKARTVKLTLSASLQTADGPATASRTVTVRR